MCNTRAIKQINLFAFFKNRPFVPSIVSHFRDFLLKMNRAAKCYNLSKTKELLFLFDLVTLFPRINAQHRQKNLLHIKLKGTQGTDGEE